MSSTGSAIGGGHRRPQSAQFHGIHQPRAGRMRSLTVEWVMRNVYPLNVMGMCDGHARPRRQRGQRSGAADGERDDVGPADREDGARSPRNCGREIATAEQAREIYKIGTCSITASTRRWRRTAWLPNRERRSAVRRHDRMTDGRTPASGPALCLGGLRADLRPAHFRLYGAAGAECRVPAAQGGMGAERHAARAAVAASSRSWSGC